MPVFALCDANNFYCSCERAFQPKLRGVPVVVLSNNDGCCIARSQEAKDLGVKMGDPWFKIEKWAVGKGIQRFSSNYVLYGDTSRRLYEVLQRFSPRVEPYSIDEMFLDLDGLGVDLVEHGRQARATILRETKIPTCVGIGDTKTKAKLANFLAKKRPEFVGVCDLRDAATCQRLYPTIPLNEVWGIGSASAKKLQALGLQTVADLAAFDVTQGREVLTVTGSRVIMELQGTSCLPLSLISPQRKGLAVTRTFGEFVTEWQGEFYSNAATFGLEPTQDTLGLIRDALRGCRSIFRPGLRYWKAGVMLNDLVDAKIAPVQMFPTRDPVRSSRLMAAMDGINGRFGRGMVRPAVSGVERRWTAKAEFLSPRYTTRLGELATVLA